MIDRFNSLFMRFASNHATLKLPGRQIHRSDKTIGNVDSITVQHGKLRVEGWADAVVVRLKFAGQVTETRPSLRRDDVHSATNLGPDVGFFFAVPFGSADYFTKEPPILEVETEAGTETITLPMRGRKFMLLRTQAKLIWRLMSLSPAILSWFITRDPKHRMTVKRGLGLDHIPWGGALETAAFEQKDREIPVPDQKISIILPVYNAFDLLPEVLQRVLRHTSVPWRLLIVEDCSTDARVRPYLEEWVASNSDHDISLSLNEKNMGFIRSVNSALTSAVKHGNHVVLLNSDALVPEHWAERLIAPLNSVENAASVTPMSNDAEIFSVPAICQRTMLEPGEADAIDAVAKRLDPEMTSFDVPTGVGFCMAMHIDFLKRIPELDTSFGRGYGEEVDWCQKVRSIGGRHIGIGNLFVEHRGGESFGSEEKLKLVSKNNAIVAKRYPYYDAEVQDFIQNDPLLSCRMVLALAWASCQREVPVYLAHSLGGGADMYLKQRVSEDLAEHGLPSVILRVGGLAEWNIEVYSTQGKTTGHCEQFSEVEELLKPLERKRLIYSCAVGHPNPMEIPANLLSLSGNGRNPIEILFHDFYPISPSYTLLDSEGVYRGFVTSEEKDPAHQPSAKGKTIQDWQNAWRPLLKAAEQIVVFSDDSQKQVAASYPDLAGNVMVRPHKMLENVTAVRRSKSKKRVIGVIGNIGFQKGAGVLQDLSEEIAEKSDLGLVLIGNLDPNYSLTRPAVIHGDYEIADLPALLERYHVTDLLIPSIWPETFSFTTHEALATGLPVMAFDLGAQGDAIRKAKNGRLLGYKPGAEHAKTIIKDILGASQTVPAID